MTLIPAAAPGDKARSAAKLLASSALARFKTPGKTWGMNLSDREFLAPALEILETPPSPVHVAFLWIICAFVVAGPISAASTSSPPRKASFSRWDR